MNWKQTENYLNHISMRGIKPGLKRMRHLMDRLGNPEKKFKSVHVTGTNGKGSVCAILEAVLNSSGIVTGLYTSPHLLNLTERISVQSRLISPVALSYWVEKIRKNAGSIEPDITYFELLTAVAFCHFAHKNVALAVIEVGLGGRLDATNVVPSPEACVITNVAVEHTHYLGNTVSQIASEKSGILKRGAWCITAAQGRALHVIKRKCKTLGIEPVIVGTKEKTILEPQCALKGEYQSENRAIVLEAITVLRKKGWQIPQAAIKEGFKNVRWPGRFDRRFIKIKNNKITLLLDGAHNPAAVKELARAVRGTDLIKRNCIVIFNALRDKNISRMVRTLLENLRISHVLIPLLRTDRSSGPESVAKQFRKINKRIPINTFSSLPDLWSHLAYKAREWMPGKEWILATGSFYLLGETLTVLNNEKGVTLN